MNITHYDEDGNRLVSDDGRQPVVDVFGPVPHQEQKPIYHSRVHSQTVKFEYKIIHVRNTS